MELHEHQARFIATRNKIASGQALENSREESEYAEHCRITRAAHTQKYWPLLHTKAQGGLTAAQEAELEESRDLLAIDQNGVHHDLADLRIFYALTAQGKTVEAASFRKTNARLWPTVDMEIAST
jgi:hypothetical protein